MRIIQDFRIIIIQQISFIKEKYWNLLKNIQKKKKNSSQIQTILN